MELHMDCIKELDVQSVIWTSSSTEEDVPAVNDGR